MNNFLFEINTVIYSKFIKNFIYNITYFIFQDSKKGAKLFKQGFGKSGQLFPYYIWEKM